MADLKGIAADEVGNVLAEHEKHRLEARYATHEYEDDPGTFYTDTYPSLYCLEPDCPGAPILTLDE